MVVDKDFSPQRLFNSLPGEWTLNRVLSSGEQVNGTARFRHLSPVLLHYREDGLLTVARVNTLPVYREYYYRFDQNQITVCFAEHNNDRPLHVLRFAAGRVATDMHLCGSDTYTGHYNFSTEDQFTVSMEVAGPHKNYTIFTSYHRAAS
jgi:hypothetical protein